MTIPPRMFQAGEERIKVDEATGNVIIVAPNLMGEELQTTATIHESPRITIEAADLPEKYFTISQPEPSGWICYMWGGTPKNSSFV